MARQKALPDEWNAPRDGRARRAKGRTRLPLSGERKLDAVLTVPMDGLGDILGRRDEGTVAHFEAATSRHPAIARCSEQSAALHHLPTRPNHRRQTELHSTCHRLSVPGRLLAEVILLPAPQPGVVLSPPNVTEQKLSGGRPR